jgi:hypothetical protein
LLFDSLDYESIRPNPFLRLGFDDAAPVSNPPRQSVTGGVLGARILSFALVPLCFIRQRQLPDEGHYADEGRFDAARAIRENCRSWAEI